MAQRHLTARIRTTRLGRSRFKLNDLSRKGQWEQMTNEVSDDIVNEFCAVGRFDQITDARVVDLLDLLMSSRCLKILPLIYWRRLGRCDNCY